MEEAEKSWPYNNCLFKEDLILKFLKEMKWDWDKVIDFIIRKDNVFVEFLNNNIQYIDFKNFENIFLINSDEKSNYGLDLEN